MVIKMFPISEDAYLFLYPIKDGKIYYRTSRNIKHLQSDKPIIKGDLCYIGMNYFPVSYLTELT